MTNLLELPNDFPYQSCPPQGYSYETTLFKRNILAIWICNHGKFSYTNKTPKSIWGFWCGKTKKYYAPINSSKLGSEVDIKDTTAYSSMQLNLNPLERAFL